MLEWKCQRDGRVFSRVNPRGTTIDCASCGAAVPKTLRERIHICKCGSVLDRDHNAALNILARAGWGPGVAKLSSDGPVVRRRVGLTLKHGKAGRTTARRSDDLPPSISSFVEETRIGDLGGT